MEAVAVTWIGTGVSGLSLVVAGIAAWKARGAEKTAREAREGLLQQQTPWTLRELQQVARVLRSSLEIPDWQTISDLSELLLERIGSIAAEVRLRFPDEEGQAGDKLDQCGEFIQEVLDHSYHELSQRTQQPAEVPAALVERVTRTVV